MFQKQTAFNIMNALPASPLVVGKYRPTVPFCQKGANLLLLTVATRKWLPRSPFRCQPSLVVVAMGKHASAVGYFNVSIGTYENSSRISSAIA
jgi:hypothetical protein